MKKKVKSFRFFFTCHETEKNRHTQPLPCAKKKSRKPIKRPVYRLLIPSPGRHQENASLRQQNIMSMMSTIVANVVSPAFSSLPPGTKQREKKNAPKNLISSRPSIPFLSASLSRPPAVPQPPLLISARKGVVSGSYRFHRRGRVGHLRSRKIPQTPSKGGEKRKPFFCRESAQRAHRNNKTFTPPVLGACFRCAVP